MRITVYVKRKESLRPERKRSPEQRDPERSEGGRPRISSSVFVAKRPSRQQISSSESDFG
ncbi:hypothetical protein BES34_018795 [Leptospira inadai serovar Lyme]|uniref:Uncharacterized protein n=1 Tax=Leptospira inadai serovar Lyme TaxID=293084 RepID=A0ABX4YE20_9LEPT|nr:hypothetical protein BES34_018795 [Leptospira inadai serovar Lyme]